MVGVMGAVRAAEILAAEVESRTKRGNRDRERVLHWANNRHENELLITLWSMGSTAYRCKSACGQGSFRNTGRPRGGGSFTVILDKRNRILGGHWHRSPPQLRD